MPDESRRWLVSGRVQGVGFRWWVGREASAWDLQGWVRNLRDGRVEAVAAGPSATLDALAAALWTGPPTARVDGVKEMPWSGSVNRDAGFVAIADADWPAEP